MMPILFLLMFGVNRYYRDVDKEIEVDPTTVFGAKGDHAIVLVGKLQKPVLKALDYAIAARHDSIEAVHVSIEEPETEKLQEQWIEQNIEVPLRIIESPYREVASPLIKYIKSPARRARLRGRHDLHAAVHRRPLVGDAAAQPQGPPHPQQAHARARRRRSRSCRGCSTRRSSSTGAGRGPCPARIVAVSRCARCIRAREPSARSNGRAPSRRAKGSRRVSAREAVGRMRSARPRNCADRSQPCKAPDEPKAAEKSTRQRLGSTRPSPNSRWARCSRFSSAESSARDCVLNSTR